LKSGNQYILHKHRFISSTEVNDFIDYLKYKYFSPRHKFEDLLNKYNWPNNKKELNFELTFKQISGLRSQLNEALNFQDSDKAFEICSNILIWGGFGVNRNIKTIDKINNQESFIQFLLSSRGFIQSKIIDLKEFDLPMNSGFSKVYSLLDEHFIIYDSRVAAKMCELINDCFGKNPEEISLGKCAHRSKANRDPGPEFPMLTGQPKKYFESNIKAGWILEKLAVEHNPMTFPVHKAIFAYQTALFVDGYKLNN
jgi:hypothetical protein